TIRRALQSSVRPSYSRSARPSKLDGFREEIHELLRDDPRIETQRILELLAERGYRGGKSITYDYVREVRPFFVDRRTYQRTSYRPGDVLQFDLWQPEREIPVGLRADAPGVRGDRRTGVFAVRGGGAGVLQAGAGRAVGNVALPGADRWAARAPGGWSRG